MESITPEAVSAHNLTQGEFARIKELLGREPNLVELGVFSVMWSEHCSYKSSRVHLKRLPTTGERVIVPPGENAGVVDVGDGWCAAFKIESHNHPSFIEPFQGAATGVGGILRDIFTMGARPVAALNSLRFGSLDHPRRGRRNRSLLAGVAAGRGGGGEIAFGVERHGADRAVMAFQLLPQRHEARARMEIGLIDQLEPLRAREALGPASGEEHVPALLHHCARREHGIADAADRRHEIHAQEDEYVRPQHERAQQ